MISQDSNFEFFTKIMKVANQMNEYGETISEVTTTNKVLRTLNFIYDHIVMAIKESMLFEI